MCSCVTHLAVGVAGRDTDEMQATWELLDANGDGSISREELCLALESCGIKLARWELRDMMDQADANGDGVIGFALRLPAVVASPHYTHFLCNRPSRVRSLLPLDALEPCQWPREVAGGDQGDMGTL